MFISFFPVILRTIVQQPQLYNRVQEQRRMRHQQEEPDGVQSVPAAQVPHGRHVQVRLSLRPPLQLVQDTLPAAGTAASGAVEITASSATFATSSRATFSTASFPGTSKTEDERGARVTRPRRLQGPLLRLAGLSPQRLLAQT